MSRVVEKRVQAGRPPYGLRPIREVVEVVEVVDGKLQTRWQDLALWTEEQRTRVSTAERLPEAIKSFLADFKGMDVRHQKAQLQAILKSAYVFRDERIELEFRG